MALRNTHRIALAASLLVSPAVVAQELKIAQVLEPIPDRLSAFGADMDAEGDTLAIGDPGYFVWGPPPPPPYHGRVYLFDRGPNGRWNQSQILTVSEETTFDQFGIGLELDDNLLVIAGEVPSTSTSSLRSFTRGVGTGWAEVAETQLDFGFIHRFFLESGTLVVEAVEESINPAIRVFDWVDGAGWMPAPAPPGLDNENVEIRAFDGASLWVINNNRNRSSLSSVLVFDRDQSGAWTQRPEFIDPRDQDNPIRLSRSIVTDNGILSPIYNDGVYAYGITPITYTGSDWSIERSVEPAFAADTRIDFTGFAEFRPLIAATSGSRAFVAGESWPGNQYQTRGVHEFHTDPARGLVPGRYREIPNHGSFAPGSWIFQRGLHTTGDQLFVAVDEVRPAASLGIPGPFETVNHGIVLVANTDQFEDPCPADFAFPIDTLDLADISRFVQAFTGEYGVRADLAPPFGVYDTADLTAFIDAFLTGCD